MPNFLTRPRAVPQRLQRLRLLWSPSAIPGWIPVLWRIAEQLSTLSFIQSQSGKAGVVLTLLRDHGSTVAMILGFLWLGWLVIREPKRTVVAATVPGSLPGLTQLMPPTGRLIAASGGVDDFYKRRLKAACDDARQLSDEIRKLVEKARKPIYPVRGLLSPVSLNDLDPTIKYLGIYFDLYHDRVEKAFKAVADANHGDALLKMLQHEPPLAKPTTLNEIEGIADKLDLKAKNNWPDASG